MGDRLASCRTSQGAARQAAAGKAPALPHHHPLLGCGVGRGTADLWRVRCGIQKVHDGHVCLAVELLVGQELLCSMGCNRLPALRSEPAL
jgi:hypothetical protein